MDRLRQSLRLAAECCDNLAVLPARGPEYRKLLVELQLIEGCCRTLGVYREDYRWHELGLKMAEVHKRSGHWLRTMPRTVGSNAAHPLFVLLAQKLRSIYVQADDLRTRATGRVGLILPPGYA